MASRLSLLGYPEPADHEGTTATAKCVALLNEVTQAAVSVRLGISTA